MLLAFTSTCRLGFAIRDALNRRPLRARLASAVSSLAGVALALLAEIAYLLAV